MSVVLQGAKVQMEGGLKMTREILQFAVKLHSSRPGVSGGQE